jgi:C1A family cysteine protease
MCDHAVTAVGYGQEKADDKESGYFIIKNSWGATWGEEGYVRIGFGRDNDFGNCGVLSDIAYPVL